MLQVATLASNPLRPAVTDDALKLAAQALTGPVRADLLDPGVAADLLFEAERPVDGPMVAERLREALHGLPLDVIVQPVAHRRKRLLLADMDSTMIGQECIDELADLVGLKSQVAAITERAMRGELPFEPALRERVALLRGGAVETARGLIDARITLTAGGPALVRTMRANGAHTALISGGFTLFTAPLAAAIGFDEQRANRLVESQGRLAGTVEEPILGREAKRDTLIELREQLGLVPEDTLAVGDGANDLAMLGEAGLGIAYRAKPAVAAAAHARLDHADLTALLYAQGYRRQEFAV